MAAGGREGSAEILQRMEEGITCSICAEIFTNPRALPCLHVYCEHCLGQHIVVATKGQRIRCPLCNEEVYVPANGVRGFPKAFQQSDQVEIYKKLCEMNLRTGSSGMSCTYVCSEDGLQTEATAVCSECVEALCGRCIKFHQKVQPQHRVTACSALSQQELFNMMKQQKDVKCSQHNQKITRYCDTCNLLICDNCMILTHGEHRKMTLQQAKEKHLSILGGTLKQISDRVSNQDLHIQEAKQAASHADQQKSEGLQKLKHQEEKMVKEVRDGSKLLSNEITEKTEAAKKNLKDLITRCEGGKTSLINYREQIETCLKDGTEIDIIKKSLETSTMMKEMKQDQSLPCFTVRVNCAPQAVIKKEDIAKVVCRLEEGQSRANIPVQQDSVKSFNARKVNQFSLKFEPSGISCPPVGDSVAVCEWLGADVAVYAPDGRKLLQMRTPPGTQAFDVECTLKHIFVTDRNSDGVLAFDYAGTFITTIKEIPNMKKISGIAFLNTSLYVTGADSNALCEKGLTMTDQQARPFARGVKLGYPLFVSPSGKSLAVSCQNDHCVHVIDIDTGTLRYTHGAPGERGDGPDDLHHPRGVVLDKANRLFIADSGNQRICVISDRGFYMGQIDLKKEMLKGPYGLTIDNKGNLVVACCEPECIVTFQYAGQQGKDSAPRVVAPRDDVVEQMCRQS